MKKLLVVLGTIASVAGLLVLAAPASAGTTASSPVVLTFTGHTSSESNPEFVYPFTVPVSHRFEMSWRISPYPREESGDYQGLIFAVGAYSDPNNWPCDSAKIWCSPNITPPSGTQTFFSYGAGRFAIGVSADEEQWVITVDIMPNPGAVSTGPSASKPTAPGIGSTITISALLGPYALTLIQVYNSYVWASPSSDPGTRPVYVKLKITNTGKGAVTVEPDSSSALTTHGVTYNPDSTAGFPPGCPQRGAGSVIVSLMPATSGYACVAFDFPLHIGLAGAKFWWTFTNTNGDQVSDWWVVGVIGNY